MSLAVVDGIFYCGCTISITSGSGAFTTASSKVSMKLLEAHAGTLGASGAMTLSRMGDATRSGNSSSLICRSNESCSRS